MAINRAEWNSARQDEGDDFNTSVNGLEEGGDSKTIQSVNVTKFGESTGDKSVFQENCKIMGWQERKIQLRNCKVIYQNNKTPKKYRALWWKTWKKIDTRRDGEEAGNSETVRLLTSWVWKLQIKF